MFYFEKMEVNDFRNDVLLAEACRSDVDKYCKHVEPGARSLLLILPALCASCASLEHPCAHHSTCGKKPSCGPQGRPKAASQHTISNMKTSCGNASIL